MTDARAFAASTRSLLNEDWRRYRNFGPYWWFVKALLKRFYSRHEMPMLGDYEDPQASEMVEAGQTGAEMLALATEMYRANAVLNLNSQRVEDAHGQALILVDPDMPG
jgi:hypothetical protein